MARTISQRHVRARRLPGKAGQLYDSSNLNEEVNVTNANPQALQKDTVTVDTAADDTDYAYEANGIDVTVNSGTGATAASIAEALADKHNASPMVRGQVKATANADVVELESTYPGVDYDIETSDDNLTVASVQEASTANAVPFGRVIIRGGDSETSAYSNRLGRLADSDGLDAASVTLTHGDASGAIVTLRIDGELFEGSGASAAALVTSLNNAVPANTVTASANGNDVTVEVDTAGDELKLVGYSGDISLSAQERGDRLADIALGISRYTYDEEVNADGDPEYPGGAGVIALRRGRIWVDRSDSVSESDPVYVQMTGEHKGRLYTERAAGRVSAKGIVGWFKDRSGDGLAVVECNFR